MIGLVVVLASWIAAVVLYVVVGVKYARSKLPQIIDVVWPKFKHSYPNLAGEKPNLEERYLQEHIRRKYDHVIVFWPVYVVDSNRLSPEPKFNKLLADAYTQTSVGMQERPKRVNN